MTTFGDHLDRALGGPEHFISYNCERGFHSVCLGDYSGRTCECECDHPLARKRLDAEREWTLNGDPALDDVTYPDECTSTDPADHQGDTCPVHEAGATVTGYLCLVLGVCLLLALVVLGNPEPALPNCPTARPATFRCAP